MALADSIACCDAGFGWAAHSAGIFRIRVAALFFATVVRPLFPFAGAELVSVAPFEAVAINLGDFWTPKVD